MYYRVAVLFVAFATVGLFVAQATRSAARAPVIESAHAHEQPYGMIQPNGMYSVATSCSAASCHGSGIVKQAGGEYTTWMEGDPHAKAFGVLYNEVSERMIKNLGRKEPAYRDASCLKCHGVDEDKQLDGEKLDDRNHSEAVSCDACHGPSKNWIAIHYQPSWKAMSDKDKFDRYGFVPSKDLSARSLNCAACHVGARDREVNHDLIAAGHPRLSFEYTRYHFSDKYLKHWVEKVPNPDFEVRSWFVGQVASLRAAVDLLSVRAERASRQNSPWPEFSESSCYSCHQGLNPDFPRSAGADRIRPIGVPGWQVWYLSLAKLVPQASQMLTQGDTISSLTALEKLRIAMETTNPDPAKIAKLAEKATAELDAILARFQRGGFSENLSVETFTRLGGMIAESALNANRTALKDYDWDFAAQHTLALTAIYHGTGGSSGPPAIAAWKPALLKLRTAIAFDSKSKDRYDSPKDYDPKKTYEAIRAMYDLTHNAKGDR